MHDSANKLQFTVLYDINRNDLATSSVRGSKFREGANIREECFLGSEFRVGTFR